MNLNNSEIIKTVERVFHVMESRYQNLWTKQYSNPDELGILFDDWVMVLVDCSKTQIDKAVAESARQYQKYPPNSGQFFALCEVTPEDLGFPTFQIAFDLARRGKWRSHPAVWFTGQLMDIHHFKLSRAVDQQPMFRTAYKQLVSRVAEAQEINPDFRLELPAFLPTSENQKRLQKRASAEKALMHTTQMLSILRGGFSNHSTV